MSNKRKIGIAIATFNSESVIADCLQSLGDPSFLVVLFDDGSSDNTVRYAKEAWPDIVVLHGDGSNWWAGGTKAAVEEAFRRDCTHVVMLNPDVEIDGEDVLELVKIVELSPLTIAAPLVVNKNNTDLVAWGGSKFGKLGALPIYTSRYVCKQGSLVSDLGDAPYEVDEAHGRGVVISRELVDLIGMLDTDAFPHYGADNDFSLRARKAGVSIKVFPRYRARLQVDNSGMASDATQTRLDRIRSIRNYLLETKNGDALRVWWRLLNRHIPRYAVGPSFVFNISLNILRRLK